MNNVQCFFCGGRDCKWERSELWESVSPGIDISGLYCNWVTDNILASQRPSTRLIREHRLLEKWKAFNIWSVVNLQEHGEHAWCGDGIEEESGFSYLPEELMDAGIYYYNFGWRDMGIPPLETMLNIVQTLVHCHAGLGRTGLAIACYLVYGQAQTADSAITHVRKKRPLAIQTRRQVQFVHDFELFLSPYRIVFPYLQSREKAPMQMFIPDTLSTIIEVQRQFCHGKNYRILKYIPKVVYMIVRRIKLLVTGNVSLKEVEPKILQSIDHFDETLLLNANLQSIQSELNKGHWSILESETDIRTLVNLLLIWTITLRDPFISLSEQTTIETANDMRMLLDSNSVSLAFFYSLNWILEILRPFRIGSEKIMRRTLDRLAYILSQTSSYSLVKPSPKPSYDHYQVTGDDTRPISVFHPDEVLNVVSLLENGDERYNVVSRESRDETGPPQSALSRRLSQVRTATRQSRRQTSASTTPSLFEEGDGRKDEHSHRRKPSMIEEQNEPDDTIVLPKTPVESDRISLRNRFLLSAGALGVSTDLRNIITEEKDDNLDTNEGSRVDTVQTQVTSSETNSIRFASVDTPFSKHLNDHVSLRLSTTSESQAPPSKNFHDEDSIANTSSLSLPRENTTLESRHLTPAWLEKQATPKREEKEKTLQRHIEEFSQDAPTDCLSDSEWEGLGRLSGKGGESGWKVEALWVMFCAYGRGGVYERGRTETPPSTTTATSTTTTSKRIKRLVCNIRALLESKP